MTYTLWFYAFDEIAGKMVARYDCFTGSRYWCYKLRNKMGFKDQYKVRRSE